MTSFICHLSLCQILFSKSLPDFIYSRNTSSATRHYLMSGSFGHVVLPWRYEEVDEGKRGGYKEGCLKFPKPFQSQAALAESEMLEWDLRG